MDMRLSNSGHAYDVLFWWQMVQINISQWIVLRSDLQQALICDGQTRMVSYSFFTFTHPIAPTINSSKFTTGRPETGRPPRPPWNLARVPHLSWWASTMPQRPGRSGWKHHGVVVGKPWETLETTWKQHALLIYPFDQCTSTNILIWERTESNSSGNWFCWRWLCLVFHVDCPFQERSGCVTTPGSFNSDKSWSFYPMVCHPP